MMKQMRENTKVILWIVVVAFIGFIFAVWGLDIRGGGPSQSGQQNALGKVDGVSISRSQFQAVYEQLASQYRAMAPDGGLTSAQRDMILDQAWDNIVIGLLTNAQIEKLGIQVSDQEVVAYLRTSPPPEIQQYFVDENGNFDFPAYQEALSNPNADWTGVEALARQRIPMLKLNQYLMAQIHVSDTEVQTLFAYENSKLTVEYVEFPIADEDVDNYEPSDEEIGSYYDENPDEFRLDERAVLEYVKIPLDPTARDIEDIMYTIRNLRDQIVAGEDFAVLAKTYSENATAEVGGETGFLPRMGRDEIVMDALDKMKPDEVSEPIRADDGVYLVKLLETKSEDGETKHNFQEIYLKLTAGSMTIDSLVTFAQQVQTQAVESSIQQAAEGNGLVVSKTAPFVQNFPITGIGYVPSILRFAFNNEVGALSNVLSDDKNYYICRVVELLPEGTAPLDSVKTEIIPKVLVENQKRMALRKAEGFHTKLRTTPASFREAVEDYGYTIHRADTFTVSQGTDGIPPYSPFAIAAFGLPLNTFSPPIESHGSIFVMNVTDRSPLNEEEFRLAVDATRSRLQQQKVEAYIVYWYDKLKADAEIEDYRSTF